MDNYGSLISTTYPLGRRRIAQSDLVGPLELVTPSSGLPVSLTAARRHLRWDDDDTSQDESIKGFLRTATMLTERWVDGERRWLPVTYDLPLRSWWHGPLRLPYPPLQSVASVKYYATDGTLTTLSTDDYTVRTPQRQPGTIERDPLVIWPTLEADRQYPVVVRFTCGYFAPFTATVADVLTSTGRAFIAGERVRLVSSNTLPAGLSADTDYYVISVSGQTFSLATSPGGSAVDVTDTGTGTHYVGLLPDVVEQAILMLTDYYDGNRSAALVDSRAAAKELPFAVEALMASEDWGSYS